MYQCHFCPKSFDKERSLKAHHCRAQQTHKRTLLECNKESIIQDYTVDKCSVYELAIKYKVSYPKLLDYLKELEIPIESWTDPERRQKRVAKIKSTWIKEYGVDNPSKLEHIRLKVQKTCEDRYGVSNATHSPSSQIKHYILGMDVDPAKKDEFREYRSQVERLTKKTIKTIAYDGLCYYSGVSIHRTGSINDTFRASIDHKIPIIEGFRIGLPPEEIAGVNNLVWCAKLLNTYKRAMTEDQFRASGIIERFKQYEGILRNTPR